MTRCALYLSLIAVALSPERANADDIETLKFLAEAYSRNRESFQQIDCRFEWTELKANTVDDAIAGQFLGPRKTRHGHWLADGELVRYELVCSDELAKATAKVLAQDAASREQRATIPNDKPMFVEFPCASTYYLRNGKFSLRYGPFTKAANLFPQGDRDGSGIRISPFNWDCLGADEFSDPPRYIHSGLDGRYPIVLHGKETIRGNELIMMSAGTNLRYKFGLDPARGHLLAYSSDSDPRTGVRHYETYLLDAREYSDHRWIPIRAINVSSPDSRGAHTVGLLEVTNVVVDEKPPRSEFALDLEAGTQANILSRNQWTNIKERERIHADDLATLQERCAKTTEEYNKKREGRQSLNTPRALPRGDFKGWWLTFNTLALASVALSAVIANSRRKRT